MYHNKSIEFLWQLDDKQIDFYFCCHISVIHIISQIFLLVALTTRIPNESLTLPICHWCMKFKSWLEDCGRLRTEKCQSQDYSCMSYRPQLWERTLISETPQVQSAWFTQKHHRWMGEIVLCLRNALVVLLFHGPLGYLQTWTFDAKQNGHLRQLSEQFWWKESLL